MWEAALFALTFFVYYLGFGWFVARGQAWLTGKPNETMLGILLYLNLPITLVYVLRHVDWSQPFTCVGL